MKGGSFMIETKKRNTITVAVIVSVIILILLGILSLTLKTFAVNVILHIYLRILFVPIIIKVLQKCFKDQLSKSMNKTLALCGSFIILDLVVVDAFRYILSKGVSSVLFLPVYLPLCFIVTMLYSFKDTGKDKKSEKRLTYIVGIPLLLLSLCFEILSFIQI